MLPRLIAASLLVGWTNAAYGQIMDPALLLKPADDRQYERKGSLFWNQETEEDWAKRLLEAPLGLDKVFVRWKPDEQRDSDVSIVICFDRRLQEVERSSRHVGRALLATIAFANGATVESKIDPLLSRVYLDGALKERCVTVRESGWHPAKRWQDVVHIAHEKRFRAENIAKVTVKVQRATKYSGVAEQVTETAELIPYIEPRRNIFRSGQSRPEVASTTMDFVKGRMRGEALHFARKCSGLSLRKPYDPPAESDTSDYAQGFATGWDLAERFERQQKNACSEVAGILEIKQSGIANLLAP